MLNTNNTDLPGNIPFKSQPVLETATGSMVPTGPKQPFYD